jgi:hypoxanthine phosphoribosyltransferase
MKILYTAGEIAEKVNNLGKEITQVYQGTELYIVGILKGGFIFMSDLVRKIDLPVKIGFARISSYGNSDSSSGDVKILHDIDEAIEGKHVIIVDDIMDTGHSLFAFKRHLEAKGPASVKICTMIDKTVRREASLSPDFYGFRIADGFIVGYGLDFAEDYRTLPDLCVLDPNDRKEPSCS